MQKVRLSLTAKSRLTGHAVYARHTQAWKGSRISGLTAADPSSVAENVRQRKAVAQPTRLILGQMCDCKTPCFYKSGVKNMTQKILILSANPRNTQKLRLDKEVREIDEALKRSKNREQFSIEQKWAIRSDDLRRAMLESGPQIVHFCGHGETHGIMIEDELGNGALLSSESLAELIGLCADTVECVLLNACYSEKQANAINEHIRYVIGMRQEITDDNAIKFAVAFYDALGAGKSVEKAFQFGCNAISVPEDLIPILKKKEPGDRPVDQGFQDISDGLFLKQLDLKTIASMNIFGHTGETIIKEFLAHVESCDNELQRKIKEIEIRILLGNPQHTTGKRADGIQKSIEQIKKFQSREFDHLHSRFYHSLPMFRGFVCQRKNSSDRIALISFYHFPPNRASKRFSQALFIDEKRTGKNPLIDIFNSWFEHFWGKTNKKELHTIIFDFDDTIIDSHEAQIEAWVDIIKKARNDYQLRQENFCEDVWECLENEKELTKVIRKKFFEAQHAKLIFERIFKLIPTSQKDEIHQKRFEIRQSKMENIKLFANCASTIQKLANEYNLIIISATDEKIITQSLEKEKYKKEHANLSEYFLCIFGKREPIFDWANIERKSQLIVKIINILGVPIERLVYVGDNNDDFEACKRIGVDFIEARLFEKTVEEAIGKKSLIECGESANFFTDWNMFPAVLKKIEQKKQELSGKL